MKKEMLAALKTALANGSTELPENTPSVVQVALRQNAHTSISSDAPSGPGSPKWTAPASRAN